MLPDPPTLAALRRTSAIFNDYSGVDKSWLRLAGTALDLADAEHRALLLRFLNSWGCRIRYPGDGDPFDADLAAWWESWGAALPAGALAELSDVEIDALGRAYADLAAVAVSSRRTLGATAASKALYALRPRAVMPWDAAIATRVHGTRDGAAFAAHLRLGRTWANAVLAESAQEEQALCAMLARPVSLAKILDEYLYVTITAAN
ncbi:hypothetical protein [Actinokineospora sp. UTMC 2448]|uniref:hypothetical protein n=1 Tax=Actinokineospora sp. UTMC 2448 TaxID=2268449 RepID=UPI0021640F93|nr:hypothetical protein [Actinokineospora sp. UTMC 2448]UVS77487.1 hypothetical protein Actkin_01198 [Actinokineospora sp. UTMC 2448]